ncbi:hypothetical protein BDY24DRAFT_397030 [Mrakia frigida]|uniref:uncharacterized protein n=1 Tax=Mrakia frigida TaxID=29902 RepID=UPI003FCBF79F
MKREARRSKSQRERKKGKRKSNETRREWETRVIKKCVEQTPNDTTPQPNYSSPSKPLQPASSSPNPFFPTPASPPTPPPSFRHGFGIDPPWFTEAEAGGGGEAFPRNGGEGEGDGWRQPCEVSCLDVDALSFAEKKDKQTSRLNPKEEERDRKKRR